jgi:hypothetical protein
MSNNKIEEEVTISNCGVSANYEFDSKKKKSVKKSKKSTKKAL